MQAAPSTSDRARVHVMSVDVEDYYHVSAFEGVVSRGDWERQRSRVVANTEHVLALLGETGATATFFVLGWVAERHPDLVRRIVAAGHTLASHSYWHRLVYDLQPEEFREDLRRAKGLIEDAGGTAVRGFRAPSYSITKRSLWALDALADEGYAYDASIFPIRHDRYGIPSAPRSAHTVQTRHGAIVEVPGSAARLGSLTFPIGGGYFRLFPYGATRWSIRRFAAVEHQPAIFYIHPWEFDPEQPRLPAPALTRFRHYNHLGSTTDRFRRLLRDFRFGSIEQLLVPSQANAPAPPVASYA